MTPEELRAEWEVTYQTRLAILCENAKPSPAQVDIAFEEAEEHVNALRSIER